MKPSQTSKTALSTFSGKKEYRKPRLTTLGNVSKITHSVGSIAQSDSFASSRMPVGPPP